MMSHSLVFSSTIHVFLFLHLVSSATSCDRCVHQSKAAFFNKPSALLADACGYGSSVTALYGSHLAAAAPAIFKDGAGCGACFQVRCKDPVTCSGSGTRVIVTGLNGSNRTDFVLSSRAFRGMAKAGKDGDLIKLGIVDVEYKRVPCEYDKNLGIRVEESSHKPDYLAIKLLFQGGQTEIVAVDVSQAGSGNWNYMSRRQGAIWETSRVPKGALDLRMVVTAGYDGKNYWAKNAMPSEWKNGVTYDSGLQITDIAQEGCSPCDDGPWKKSS